MGAGGLAVDAMVIGCLGVERRVERLFVLSHFYRFFCLGHSKECSLYVGNKHPFTSVYRPGRVTCDL